MVGTLQILGLATVLTASLSEAIKLPRSTPQPSLMDRAAIKKIIEGLGMVYEPYRVETEDGYILHLNRMVNPKLKHKKDKGVPILLVNGLAMWSEAWFLQPIPIMNPPVAWLLKGYDVWLGDPRGSGRSRRHRTMSPTRWKFWDFSFHEIGVYDLPAFIDFILSKTKHRKLAYSGVSNSGTYYYVMCAERPEYQDKLYGGILLAPLAEAPQLPTLRLGERLHIYDGGMLLKTLWAFGIGAYPHDLQTTKRNFYTACKLMTPDVYIAISNLIMGSGCKFQKNTFCAQVATAFGGTSTKNVIHAVQLFDNGGRFSKYDYGVVGNLKKYGQRYPPVYNVSRVTAFTALYYSDTDAWTPGRVVKPFVKRFKGPTYECMTHGVCHVFHLLDPRSGPFMRDTNHVLDSMTGRANSTKMYSKKCNIKW